MNSFLQPVMQFWAWQQRSTSGGVRPNGQEDTPQYHVIIDQAQAGAMGVSIAEINTTMGMAWGGSYINDFVDRGRVKKVYVQGEADARMMPQDLDKWYVRNNRGEMVLSRHLQQVNDLWFTYD